MLEGGPSRWAPRTSANLAPRIMAIYEYVRRERSMAWMAAQTELEVTGTPLTCTHVWSSMHHLGPLLTRTRQDGRQMQVMNAEWASVHCTFPTTELRRSAQSLIGCLARPERF